MNNTASQNPSAEHPFRMVRYFSVGSLLCVLVAALLLVFIFRKVTIQTIVELSERGNLTLAQASLNSIRPQLVRYFISVKGLNGTEARSRGIDEALHRTLVALANNNALERIKLYNDRGVVAFSTKSSQIGMDQMFNPGFASAINGQVASKLIYGDTFNSYDSETEDDNLIQSYLPVRADQNSPVLGVFEIYTDVDPLVRRTENASILVGSCVGLVLILLYAMQVGIVRRADRIIAGQQDLIRDRSRTLEILSAQLLTAQEDEKKRIAKDLHEGIAQTLSAVKTRVELACQGIQNGNPDKEAKDLKALLPPIQGAIHEISAFAMALRPASLDDFGLLPTLSWWCREFQTIYPRLQVATRFDLEEQDIPAALKVVIYRIIQETLTGLSQGERATRVTLALEQQGDQILLTIEDNGVAYHPTQNGQAGGLPGGGDLAMIKERTVLSGGVFHISSNHRGGTVRQAAWPC